MSKKLIATRVFYSYQGLNNQNSIISHGSGAIDVPDEELFDFLLKGAQNSNSEVASIQILSICPLELKEVKDAEE